MAYFGTDFKFEREENFQEFLISLGLPEAEAQQVVQYRPNIRVTKNGDNYTFTFSSPQGNKETTFQNGVTFDEELRGGNQSKTTITVDGNTFTQVQNIAGKGSLTFKREFTANSLKMTVTSSNWDGVAYRYYVPA